MADRPVVDVAFDPLEPGFVEWPYAQYDRLRAHDPVHRSALLHGWVLTRYDDIHAVLRDPTVSVELARARPTPLVVNELERQKKAGREPNTLVLRDEPDHGRLRRLMQQPFGPRAVETLRAMVAAHVDAAFAAIVQSGRDEIDVVDDFAYPLPVAIFCEMLGIPAEDSPRFRTWTRAVARNLDPLVGAEERSELLALHDETYAYLGELVEEKRRRPSGDIMSALVHAEEDGDRLTRDELVAQLVTLYVAGHEPTTALVGNGLLGLLRQPDQLARAQAEPDLLPNLIQELLRYDGPNQFVRRIATRPMALGSGRIEAGDVIYACIGAGNHDSDRWGEDAGRVRIDRPDASQHLQFGSGIHTCLGSHLARLQAETMMGALLTRLSDLELAGEPAWSPRMVLRSVEHLPVRFRLREPATPSCTPPRGSG